MDKSLKDTKKSSGGLTSNTNNNPTFKKTKLYNSRQIRTQIQDDSFTNPPKGKTTVQKVRKMLSNGSGIPNKLNIPEYLASREFEIRALDSAMVKSKTSGASRVFQTLPRTLRRRTASHNVRRIPKRMRKKALKEMGLQIKPGASNVVLGTKGVTISGKPIKAKLGRGRARWAIVRKIKLLKYAAKWKLKGKLPSSQWVSVSQLNLRKKINLLKKDLNSMNDSANLEDLSYTNNPSVKREVTEITNLANNVHNNIGSYDNTSVNKLSKIGKITSLKYATRQKQFKWLPTHIWHAKRAKMMKRWQWTIPNEPTQRCYRSTSRASRLRGSVVSDTSYIGTIVINISSKESVEKTLEYISSIVKGKINFKKHISKGIAWNGYIYHTGQSDTPLGRATLIFIGNGENDSMRIMVRVDPSIYSSIYNKFVFHFGETPTITIHDCKYSIGSINLTGPKSITALQSILHSRDSIPTEQFSKFINLFKINDLTSIPEGTIFTFNVCDPRFKTKPILPVKPKVEYDDQLDIIMSFQNTNNTTLDDSILKPDTRAKTYINQMSLKELGKRRAMHPGESIPLEKTDVSICVMLIKSYEEWTLLLPWYWVMPFWNSLVHVPHVQFGGFKQAEQLRLERKLLGWSDMVFTENGFIQCELEKDEFKKKWEKRPKSKKIMYDKVEADGIVGELLSPFGLDWRGLQALRFSVCLLKKIGKAFDMPQHNNRITADGQKNIIPQSVTDICKVVKAFQSVELQLKEEGKHRDLVRKMPITLYQKGNSRNSDHQNLKFTLFNLPPLSITPIYMVCVGKGNIACNSKIYEINEECTSFWKNVSTGTIGNVQGKSIRAGSIKDIENCNPKFFNIIGLVSSSTFSLIEGKSVAIGLVDSDIVCNLKGGSFLIRNVASASYSLVDWKHVDMSK